MVNRQKLSVNLNKIQKLRAQRGIHTVFKQIIRLTTKKNGKSAFRRTLAVRNLLLKNHKVDRLTHDIEYAFSRGLLRPAGEVKANVKVIPFKYIEPILNEAERIVRNEFTIYGSVEACYAPGCFSWKADPLTGFVWPLSFSPYGGRINKPYRTDIKTIWEIARFQFLSPLAYAYIFSGEERFARFAADKINSWIDENPFLQGPHWYTPMESSIRLINWCVYLPLIDIFQHADCSLKNKLVQSILENLIFIRENLENSPLFAGNHYLADLVGLLLARLLFPSLDWASKTTHLAINEFDKELQSQFHETGINFEGSLAYHRLSYEMGLVGVALIKRNGMSVTSGIDARMKQIADFTNYYSSVSKNCPVIGDNDSGIYLKYFPGQEANQHGYLTCLSDAVLENKSAPTNVEEFLCSIHFTNAPFPNGSENSDRSKASNYNRVQVREFGGLIIARSRHEALFFNTLQSTEGHSHNDKLSVYPVIGGKLLFIDRGSFSYTGYRGKRHEDRKNSSHNSPLINDWEQSTIWKYSLFYNNGEAKCSKLIENNHDTLTLLGWHVGYDRFIKGLIVFRQIQWNINKCSMLITDWVDGITSSEIFELKLNFLVNPLWSVGEKNGGYIFGHNNQTVELKHGKKVSFVLEQGLYCPSYQSEVPCQSLIATCKLKIGEKINYFLYY